MTHRPLPALSSVLALVLLLAVACSSGSDGGKLGKVEDLDIQVDPPSYTFPATLVGQPASKTFAIRHIGVEGTLKLSNIGFATTSEEFTLEAPDKLELEAGEETLLTVTYTPVDEEADEIDLEIGHNSELKANPHVITLRTVSPQGALFVFPSTIAFGEVESGDLKTVPVRIENKGSKSVQLESIGIREGGSPDFYVDSDLGVIGLPRAILPNEEIEIVLGYEPTGGDADEGILQLIKKNEDQSLEEMAFELSGREVGAKLTIVPAKIDFGWVNLGESRDEVVILKNTGERPLVVTDVSLTDLLDGLDGSLTLIDLPEAGVSIEPNDRVEFGVSFEAKQTFVPTGSFIARVRLETNDANQAEAYVPVFGRVSAPTIVATPNPVDFGFVATNDTQTRDLTIINTGFGDLLITEIEIVSATGEFTIETDESFGPLATIPSETILPADEYYSAHVRFTNQGGTEGEAVSATLILRSNDPVNGEATITLNALRASQMACAPVFQPEVLNFGFVAHGYSKKMSLTVANTGTGPCQFQKVMLGDCMSFFGIEQCSPGNMSSYFKLMGIPQFPGGLLSPGQSVFFPILYTPPSTGVSFDDLPWGEFEGFAAMMLLKFTDPSNQDGDGNDVEISIPEITEIPGANPGDPPQQLGSANVRGSTGKSCLTLLPNDVDFGLVGIGCTSEIVPVKVYNTCTKPIAVKALSFDSCGPEFKIAAYPPLPQTLTMANTMEIGLVYGPQDLGLDQCALLIETEDVDLGAFSVPLSGEGTFDMDQDDEFTQTTGQEVDILFVVDNSGSMGDDQENLSANFGKLTAVAQQWQNDFHIGVVTTDMEGMMSSWCCGNLVGPPKYVTNENWEIFQDNVKVGDNGSATEQGLYASQAALSFPLAHDTSIACEFESDCEDPDTCVEGFCGGENRGFMRQDATLHVVYVSDEQDDSPAELNFYTDFLMSIKGYQNPNLLYAHAVVAGVEPEGTFTDCAGEAGTRYMEVADQTNGIKVDICEPDWAATLEILGDAIFGLKTQFFLTRPADPATVQVWVQGIECEEGWSYDQASNSVIFDQYGSCMPEPEEIVLIHYEVICYQF